MDRDPETRRFYFTPMQRVIALLVGALVVALFVVAVQVPSRGDRIWDWRYPDGIVGVHWPAPPPHPAQSMVNIFNTNANSVFAFYRRRLHLSPGTGALFSVRSRGIFGGRNLEEMGVIPSAATVTNLRSELLIQYLNGQSKLILSSQMAGASNTTVWVNLVPNKPRPIVPISLWLQALRYPGSQQGSGGAVMHGTGFTFIAKTNFAAVASYYARSFGTNAASGSPQASGLKTIGDPKAELFNISQHQTPANEVAFLLLTERTISLIHAAANGTNTTHISIGTVAR